ncbi:MAG: hypothetical protein Q8K31_05885 [Burkholderiaceae bacterium]|nr:hypothetical protein [Burkholderiaceae bacterium]
MDLDVGSHRRLCETLPDTVRQWMAPALRSDARIPKAQARPAPLLQTGTPMAPQLFGVNATGGLGQPGMQLRFHPPDPTRQAVLPDAVRQWMAPALRSDARIPMAQARPDPLLQTGISMAPQLFGFDATGGMGQPGIQLRFHPPDPARQAVLPEGFLMWNRLIDETIRIRSGGPGEGPDMQAVVFRRYAPRIRKPPRPSAAVGSLESCQRALDSYALVAGGRERAGYGKHRPIELIKVLQVTIKNNDAQTLRGIAGQIAQQGALAPRIWGTYNNLNLMSSFDSRTASREMFGAMKDALEKCQLPNFHSATRQELQNKVDALKQMHMERFGEPLD